MASSNRLMTVAARELRVGDVVHSITGQDTVTALTYGPGWVTVDCGPIELTYSGRTRVRISER